MRRKVSLEEHNAAVNDLDSVIGNLRDEVAELRASVANPAEWLEAVTARRVVVHRAGGESIEGSLTANMVDGLVLRAAKLLHDNGKMTELAGEVFVPRAKVSFIQTQD